MAEQRTFVFAVSFIVIFSALVSTIPAGLLGQGTEPEAITPLDSELIYGFSASANYMRPNFTSNVYDYDLNSRTWRGAYANITEAVFSLGAKQLIFGFLWLGGMDYVYFIDDNGTNRDVTLTFTEITANAENGFARYSLQYVLTGQSAGTWLVYWNDTKYPDDPNTAWENDELYITHGVGVESTAVIDTGTLLIQLLTFQLPDVPFLVNLMLVTPIWACVLWVIWYLIKETTPFV